MTPERRTAESEGRGAANGPENAVTAFAAELSVAVKTRYLIGTGPVVCSQDTSNDILVDVYSKCFIDLLRDSKATKARVEK
jgi:hypothetical protein